MPEGTSPGSAVRQQASGPGASKGLRIGGIVIPWWAVGVGAVGVGLVGFLIYRNMRSSGQGNASATASPMAPGVSPSSTPTAATLVPLPYPTASTTSGQTATAASGLGSVTLGGVGGQPGPGIFATNVAAYQNPTTDTGKGFLTVPFGTYPVTGAPIAEGGQTFYPISGPGGQQIYALGENVLQYNPSSQSLAGTQLAGQAA